MKTTERIIPREPIPEPPPEQWRHEDQWTWSRDGYRVMFLFSLEAWSVFECEDPGWLGPIGTFETAEDAMQAIDNDELLDQEGAVSRRRIS